jgi:hypothetical protein
MTKHGKHETHIRSTAETRAQIRDEILDFLKGGGEFTAAQIMTGIRRTAFESAVNNQLNALRTDGLVDMKPRARNRQSAYFLVEKPEIETPSQLADKKRKEESAAARIKKLEAEIKLLEKALDLETSISKELQKEIAELRKRQAAPAKPKKPALPRTISGLNGYLNQGDKVTLFIDRRLNAKSVTFEAGKLEQLAEMARGC